jgi:signal transduction histidine kinase
MGLAYLLARKLEGLISRPILDLARASAEISRRGDYSIRVKKWGDDEVGLLTDEFNAMLDQIRKRNEERERLNAELESKNKELEQIIYVASHDLRSPLINIQGFNKEIDFILKSALPSLRKHQLADPECAGLVRAFDTEIPGHMEYIFNSLRKMDALLKGLLRVSRLGRDPVTFSTVDVQSLLGEVLGAFEFKMKAEGIVVEVGSLPPCRGDAVKMNQVFSNLVDNAIKYRAPGRPLVIRISGKAEDGRVVYCVEDNGIGIAPEHHARIFEIFNRLDPGKTEGEGLGLTVVSKIVVRHGGAVRVESEPGRGSRFFVAFPAAAGRGEKPQAGARGPESPGAGGGKSGEASA